MAVEELLLARLQSRPFEPQLVLQPHRFVSALRQILSQRLLDVVSQFGRESYRLVEPQHSLLYDFDRDRGLLAGGPLLVATAADEVLVDDAVAVLRVLDDQAAPAFGTDDRALQVVVMGAFFFVNGVERQHVLDTLPGDAVDDRFVTAWVGDALEGHEPLVVRVGEHLLELHGGDRFGGTSWCRAGCEAAKRELFGQAAERPLAARVGREGVADERCAVFVRNDGTDFASFLVQHALVAVTERRLARSAAGLGFLDHSLEHFVGEVAGVELSDGTHHAVEQHAGRGLVDVLGRGDESDAGVLQCEVDLDVVSATAREAVDLVDDPVGDRVLTDVLQHPLELGSVGGACGLTTIDEDLDDLCAEALGLAKIRLALRRDRVPLRVSVLLGLL